MGWGSRTIALVSLAMVVIGCLGSTATPRLAGRVGDKTMLALGGAVCAAGFLTMTAGNGSAAPYLVGALLVGLATGIFEAVTRTLAAEVVDEDETALSVGLNELALSLGAAIGAAVIGALFAAHHSTAPGGPLTLAAFRWSWSVCAGVALLGAVVGLAFRHGTAGHGRTPVRPAQPLTRNGDAV